MGDDKQRRRQARLRWSILAAAGIIPIACSGKHLRSDDDPESDPHAIAGASSGGKGSSTGGKTGGKVAGAAALAGAGAGGAQSLARPSCTDPQLNPTSGLVYCAEGYEHRPAALECLPAGGAAAELPAAGGAGAGEAGGSQGGAAGLPRADGEVGCRYSPEACLAFELGYCDEEDVGGGGGSPVCRSGCVTDDDCGAGYICICDAPSPTGGKCLLSDCTTNADCGPGYRCASYGVPCGLPGFACQRAADECVGSTECDGGYCGWEGSSRACDSLACGRPFLVEANARVSPVSFSRDWLSDTAPLPQVEQLSTLEREALAAVWTRMALLEHASIAAFARFSLQLLSLGAPSELVEGCTGALADETAHAKLCFELASAYAGRAIGPGPLDIAGSLQVTSLSDIVDLVILEGCFGETGAALEALEAADAATDLVIRQAYSRIAEDEQRHAELAFKFLRWAFERDSETVRRRIAAAVAAPSLAGHPAGGVALPCLHAISGRRAASGMPRTGGIQSGKRPQQKPKPATTKSDV